MHLYVSDSDDFGQITRKEMWDLKNLFWRSKLSKLSASELLVWASNDKCVDTDLRPYVSDFKAKEVSGLAMWTYGIQNPSLMKRELGITNDMKRARLSEAVCREIVGQGCLHDGIYTLCVYL